METVKEKKIFSKIRYGGAWYGIDYCINLYHGCSFGCIYCESRSSCYHIENFDKVRLKEHALETLERELKRVEKGVVSLGSLGDCYNPCEKKQEETKEALKLLYKYNFGVSIETKSTLVERDIDLLKKIGERNNVIIQISMTTASDKLSKILEPHAPVSSKRLETVKKLSEEGLFVGIVLSPVLPFITDTEENIKEMVRLAKENGAKFIYADMSITLKENSRDYYYQKLDRHFKDLKYKYIRHYGGKYHCNVPNASRLYTIFAQECEQKGLLYQMSDIIASYKTKCLEQMTLF